jgi:hypothetical protein
VSILAIALLTGSHLICVGEGACSSATSQTCSVALGNNVQLPDGAAGNHVFATENAVVPLQYLDAIIVERINGTLRAYGRRWRPDWKNPQIDPTVIAEWNAACSRHISHL